MGPVLRFAGIYNLLWGTAVILLPNPTMRLAGFDPGRGYPQMWQCIGMIVGVYGVGYWLAARAPYRHWPITLVGFLGKTFGPIGALGGIATGELPPRILWTNLFNDLVWWFPFLLILLGAWRAGQVRQTISVPPPNDAPPNGEEPETVRSRFADAVDSGRTLVVFLRHSGCTFCREAIADLDGVADELFDGDVRLLLIPPGPTDRGKLLGATRLASDDRVVVLPDPGGTLADDHGLLQGGAGELFGPSVWRPGFQACVIDRHGVGPLDGNGFQLPGLFLYDDGSQVAAYRHRSAHDRPDYARFVREGSRETAAGTAGAPA